MFRLRETHSWKIRCRLAYAKRHYFLEKELSTTRNNHSERISSQPATALEPRRPFIGPSWASNFWRWKLTATLPRKTLSFFLLLEACLTRMCLINVKVLCETGFGMNSTISPNRSAGRLYYPRRSRKTPKPWQTDFLRMRTWRKPTFAPAGGL